MIFLFLFSFSFSDPALCFSETGKCDLIDSSDLLIVNLAEPDLYNNIQNFIVQKKRILIFFNARANINDFQVEIPLSLFADREISFSFHESMYKPKSIVFTYTEHDDFSSTSIYNSNYDISFQYIGKSKGIIDFKFNIFSYQYAAKSVALPSDKPVVLQSNYLSCSTSVLLSFLRTVVLDSTKIISIFVEESSNISIYPDKLVILEHDIETTIMNEQKQEIEISTKVLTSSLRLIGEYIEESEFPVINLININYLILCGEWPKREDEIKNKIYNNIQSVVFLIEVHSDCLPFNIYGFAIYFNLYNHIEVLGQLVCSNELIFIKGNSSIEVVYVHMKYVEAKINTNIASIDITIDKYVFAFPVNYLAFPISITFDEKHISHISIKDLELSGLTRRILNYDFLNRMQSKPSDEELSFLFTDKKPFLEFPKILFFYYETNLIFYSAYSNSIDGLNNARNILKLNIDDSTNVVRVSTYATDSLSQIETKFCIGDQCQNNPDLGVHIENTDDLAASFDFSENANRFFIYLFSDKENFTIGLQNIPNKDLILRFLVAPNYSPENLAFVFPPTNETISSIKFNFIRNSKLTNFNKFVAKHIEFVGVNSDETTRCEFECDHVETDYFSINAIMSTDYIENLTVHDDFLNVAQINLLDDSIGIMMNNIKWSKVGNLTIVGSTFYLSIDTKQKIPTFHIVCSSEPAEIIFIGNWKDAKFEDSIHIHANGFKTTLNFMEPFNHEEIKLHGDGKFSIKYSYSSQAKICIYNSADSFCSGQGTAISYDDFAQVESIDADFLDIGLADFDSLSPSFNLSVFQTKQVKYTSLIVPHLKVDVTPPGENQDLLEFIFENIDLNINSTQENVSFNYLTLINSKIHSDADVLVTNYLTCSFENLVGWKDVFINEILSVSGQFLLTESFRVTLLNEIADYTADISLSSIGTLSFAENSMRINNGVFLFPNTHGGIPIRLDLVFALIDLEYDANTKKVPYCSISTDLMMSSICFIGDWSAVDHYFKIMFSSNLNFINSYFVRCDITGVGVLYYVSTSAVNGINGTVNLKSPDMVASPTFVLRNNQENYIRTKIIFENLILDPNYQLRQFSPFEFKNSTIDLEIIKMAPNTEESVVSYKLNLLLDEFGVSTVTLVEPFHNFLIKSLIEINMNINGMLKADDEYAVIRNNFTILKGVRQDMITDFTLKFIYNDNQAVKAFMQILGIESVTNENDGYTSVVLFSKESPAKVSYNIQMFGYKYSFIDLYFSTELYLQFLFNILLSHYLQNIQIMVSGNMATEYIRLSEIDDKYCNVTLVLISDLMYPNSMIRFDSPGSEIQVLNILSLIVNNTQDVSFENLKRLSIIDTVFISQNIFENFTNLEYFSIDMKSYLSFKNVANISSPDAIASIECVRCITLCEDGWLLSEELTTEKGKIFASDFQQVHFMGSRITLSLENPGKQTKIPETLIQCTPLFSETDVLIVFNDGFDKISNLDDLKITIAEGSIVNKIVVSTTFFPVPDIFPPDVRVEIVCNVLSNQNFRLTEQVLTNKTIDVDLADVSNDKRMIQANSVNVKGMVEISFINAAGLLMSNQLNLMNGGHLSVTNYKINSSIVAEPKTSSLIERMFFEDDIDLEIHWLESYWPTMMIGIEDSTKKPSKIRVILDEDSPDYERYYDFTYLKSHSILVGSFNCERWKSQVHFESSDQFFKDGSDLIFNVTCLTDLTTGNDIMSIFGSKPLPLPNDNSESKIENGKSKSTIVISIAVAIIIVICVIIGIVVFFTTKRKYEAILKQKMKKKRIFEQEKEEVNEKCINDESEDNDNDLVEIEQIAQSSDEEDVSFASDPANQDNVDVI